MKEKDKKLTGEQIFINNCRLCHGADGKLALSGATDLSSSTLSYDETIQVVTYGRRSMQPFGKILSNEEIEAVTSYVHRLRE